MLRFLHLGPKARHILCRCREAPDSRTLGISSPEGTTHDGVYRPFGACVSIGLPTVAYQPRLGM